MIGFVVDASAAVELFARDVVQPELRRRVLTGRGAAPELLDVESANVLRSMVMRDEIPSPDARQVLGRIRDSPFVRVSHRLLVARCWELRDSVTAYDAAYLALAEQLGVPLLTCDARRTRAHGHDAEVIVYPRG